MAEVELNDLELSILINALQSRETLGKEEIVLLKKLGDIYKASITLTVPPE